MYDYYNKYLLHNNRRVADYFGIRHRYKQKKKIKVKLYYRIISIMYYNPNSNIDMAFNSLRLSVLVFIFFIKNNFYNS